jgi:hypothetical protein
MKFGGLDLCRDLKIEQGVESLYLIMRHLRYPAQLQQMLLITIAQLQHNSGLGTHILEDPFAPAPHLEGRPLDPPDPNIFPLNQWISTYC